MAWSKHHIDVELALLLRQHLNMEWRKIGVYLAFTADRFIEGKFKPFTANSVRDAVYRLSYHHPKIAEHWDGNWQNDGLTCMWYCCDVPCRGWFERPFNRTANLPRYWRNYQQDCLSVAGLVKNAFKRYATGEHK